MMRNLPFLVLILGGCNFFTAAIAAPGEQGSGRTPPVQATQACQGKQSGEACGFETPRGTLSGICRDVQNAFACVPEGRNTPRGNATQFTQSQVGIQRGPVSQPLPDSIPVANSFSGGGRVVDTAQTYCFDDNGSVITCPKRGEKFFGQDAQYTGLQPSYRDNGDGTISDINTKLIWQKAHNAKRVSYYDAKRDCEMLSLGGKQDW
jgi:hypothetical protein